MTDWPLLEHGEYLLEQGCRFRLSRVQSGKCADLQSDLGVTAISRVCLRTLGALCTCHRLRTLPIITFDATNFSRMSPDFHNSLRLGSFFFPRFGLIEFSQSSRSRMILWNGQIPAANGKDGHAYSASSLRSVSRFC